MTGIAGTVAACVWGAIAYKNRGPAMTTSRYLMRLRVIAQSCVVGSIMAGIGVTALQNKIEARSKKDQLWKKNCLLKHDWHCTYTVTTKKICFKICGIAQSVKYGVTDKFCDDEISFDGDAVLQEHGINQDLQYWCTVKQ